MNAKKTHRTGNQETHLFTASQKSKAHRWFLTLQKTLCHALENIENTVQYPAVTQPALFQTHQWTRPGGGGGKMCALEGNIFEKAGVNVSAVYGHTDTSNYTKEHRGSNITKPKSQQPFWASGLSVVIHPRSPFIPSIHMNTRIMHTHTAWFGGGIDLTPTFPCQQETEAFHKHLQNVCNTYRPDVYPTFKKAADDYFFLPHRNEPRGVGGIFYDHLQDDFEKLFSFTKSVGNALLDIYAPLVHRHKHTPWTAEDKQAQLCKRARYAEFNLLYDKGTRFGLETSGFIEAIFMSMPPLAAWPSPLPFSPSPSGKQTL